MASTNFTYQPTTGRGNGTIKVTAKSNNENGADRITTLTISNGAVSKNVTIKQKYRPYFILNGSSTIPATGGSVSYVVHTEYDIVFTNVPDWITISQNGTAISPGQRLTPGEADNKTFTFTAAANTGDARSVENSMVMRHYISDSLSNYVSYFSFSQEAAEIVKNITLSSTAATVTSASTSYTISVTTENCSFCGMTYTNSNSSFPVSAVKSGNNIRLTYSANTGSQRATNITFKLKDEDNTEYTSTFKLTQSVAVIQKKWYINNTLGFNIYGSLLTTSTDISVEIANGEVEERTETPPVTITGFAIVASPLPSSPQNIRLVLSNPNNGQSITGNYNGDAWMATGSLTVNENETLTLTRG